jgi:hypothetical protein
MPLDAEDLKKIQEMIGGVATLVAPENLAKVIAPIVEAQNKANGVLTKAELEAQKKAEADKAAADKALADKAEADRKAAEEAEKLRKAGKEPPVKDPAVVELEKRVAELTKANTDAAAREAAAKEQARIDALHNATRDALIKAGIPADRVKAAMASVKEDGVLTYDGDRPGWKGTDPKTNAAAVLDLESAAAAWVKADGKLFLPPAGTGGTGGDPNNGARSGPKAQSVRNADGSIDIDRALGKFLSPS